MAPNCNFFACSVLFNFLLQDKNPIIRNKLIPKLHVKLPHQCLLGPMTLSMFALMCLLLHELDSVRTTVRLTTSGCS